MIPKSICYKAVRRDNNLIIAEGNKAEIARMCKADKSLYIGLSASKPMIGQVFGTVVVNAPDLAHLITEGIQ